MRPCLWLVLGPRIAPRVPLARPSLLIANHLTAFDVPVVLYALTSNDRDHAAVAMSGALLSGWRRGKAERHRLMSLFTPLAYLSVSALFNVFPLPRGAGLRQSFAHAGAAMDKGYHVLVFPEGETTTSETGEMAPFHPGIGVLAENLRIPIVPIRMDGVWQMKQEGRRLARIGEITVRIGAPVSFKVETSADEIASSLQSLVGSL